MADTQPTTILCLASYEKGAEFIREAHRQGARIILLTPPDLEQGDWPRESIDELFTMPDLSKVEDVIKGVSYLARSRDIHIVVALDDYDVETAAALREHLRLPGMGATTARQVRDKLAMRTRAREHGILVPEFVPILSYASIGAYTERVPGPWLLKPRSEVSTIGIARIDRPQELWQRLEELGDRQSYYLLERFIPGDVYHVDSIISEHEIVFAEAHQYGRPPIEVFHGGGIAMSRTLPRGSAEERALQTLNREVIAALGLMHGATHMEFIRGEDERFYFLEVGARVGGANTAEMVEAATGLNLWREWARVELLQGRYQLPERRYDYGGVIISLARQEYPDTSAYTDPEIVWRMNKRHHVGFVLRSSDPERIRALLAEFSVRFAEDFHTSLPPYQERPPSHASEPGR